MSKLGAVFCLTALLMVSGCSSEPGNSRECSDKIRLMVEKVNSLEAEISKESVCVECVRELVKMSGGIQEISEEINQCSIDGGYTRRMDFLVTSMKKRVDNIIFEIDWVDENRPSARYFDVIEDRVKETQVILTEMMTLIE